MQALETKGFQAALKDYSLASGYLVLVLVDQQGQIQDYNHGFEISVRPVRDARGQPLQTFLCAHSGQPVELTAGLEGGAPIPYFFETPAGTGLVLNAYPVETEQILLIGSLVSYDSTESIQRVSRLTTEMGNLVRQLRRANREIQDLANKDPLTGVASRRYFLQRLEDAVAHARRYGHPLTLLMLDLDHFKQVNDRYGHPGGDAVLRALGQRLLAGARASDLSGRLGGEEFALLLPNTGLDEARALSERLRLEIGALRPLGLEMRFTASMGLALLQAEDRVESLVSRADQALYAAKSQGRDRVVVDQAASA